MSADTRKVYIDADHILYNLASPPSKEWSTSLKGKSLKEPDIKTDVKRLKGAFKSAIKEYEAFAEIEALSQGFKIGKVIPVISYKTNFRYTVFPEYKANRKDKEHTESFIALRKWARKKYSYEDVEADDVVAYYVRKGAIGFSADKDLLKGVPGIWFDTYHARQQWVYTTERDAMRFNLMQYLAGDPSDSIPGLPRVGMPTAEKLLDRHGWHWKGVVAVYQEYGLTAYDAIITRRLISMEQWTPKGGVKLFQGEDDE